MTALEWRRALVTDDQMWSAAVAAVTGIAEWRHNAEVRRWGWTLWRAGVSEIPLTINALTGADRKAALDVATMFAMIAYVERPPPTEVIRDPRGPR